MGNEYATAPLITIAPTLRELGGLSSSTGADSTPASVIGIGRAAAEQVSYLLDNTPCRLLVSLGYAGALAPHLLPSDLVVVNAYLHGASAPVPGNPHAARAAMLLRRAGLSVQEGPVLTVDEPLLTPRAKRRAYTGTGALVVDMEGRWIAEEAATRGVPLIAIRAVLDEASFTLPPFIAAIIADAGQREWAHAVRALTRPSTIRSLLSLALKSRGASQALQKAVDSILSEPAHLQ